MSGSTVPEVPKRFCRCEARIAAAILDGYACGNPDCWRTATVEASFADFVADLVVEREQAQETSNDGA